MKKALFIFSMYLPILSIGQLSGGGDLNPDLFPDKEAQKEWMDRRVGLSVHWGPSSLGGGEISWSRGGQIKKEVYDNYYKDFDPSKFNAQEWVAHLKRWGMRYISPTAKHHDGFALWFSEYTPYDMENAKRKVDIMAELSTACKENDIMLGAYYSNLDWYHPDWAPYLYGGPGELIPAQDDSPNLERYFTFFEKQVKELIEKYDVEFIQFDGEWDDTYTHEVGSRLYRAFHEVKPEILLNSRIDIGRRMAGNGNHLYLDGTKYAGDFQDRERLVNYGNDIISWLDHPWQAWVTIDKTQWSYKANPKLMSKEELIIDLISVVGNNGNYMINLGPRPDGSFEPEQVGLMNSLGDWLHKHQEAIYGTRGGPFYPFKKGVSTRKGYRAWVFVIDSLATSVTLPMTKQRLISAKVFGTNNEVPYTIDGSGAYAFDLSRNDFPDFIKVVALTFDRKVTMVDRKENESTLFNNATKIVEDIVYDISSKDKKWHQKEDEARLLNAKLYPASYAFHTKEEASPNIIIDVGSKKKLAGLLIKNREGCCQERAKNLKLWTSLDAKKWDLVWEAGNDSKEWTVPLSTEHMGASTQGREARYLKLGMDGPKKKILHLKKVEVYEVKH